MQRNQRTRSLKAPVIVRLGTLLAGLWLSLGGALPVAAAGDYLVVFDLSGSMGNIEDIRPARETLTALVEEIETPGARWGLRVYGGHCPNGDWTCLLVPMSRDGLEQMRQILPGLDGRGGSPMAEALRAAREGEMRNASRWQSTAILVSDGLVEPEKACAEARLLRLQGVRIFVIGLEFTGTSLGKETLRYLAEHPNCAAGTYIRADRPDLLGKALQSLAQATYALPYRLLAALLALVAGYYTTRFVEYALVRLSRLPQEYIPYLCRGLFALLACLSLGLFLGRGAPLWLLLALLLLATGLALVLVLTVRAQSALARRSE